MPARNKYFNEIALIFASAIFMFGTVSCGKFSASSGGNLYARTEVAAIESAFWAVNSGFMSTEGQFLNSTCTSIAPQMTCNIETGSNYIATYNWSSCRFNSGSIGINGVWTDLYLADASPHCQHPPVTNQVISRKSFGGPTDPPIRYYLSNSDTLDINTNQYAGFPGQAMGDWGIHSRQVSATQRQMRIDTLQMVRKNVVGSTLYDVFLQSDPLTTNFDISATGTLAGGNRLVTGFTYVYFANVQRIKVTFNNVLWSDATCCYPKSGSLNLVFDDFIAPNTWTPNTKTSTLNFNGTCGLASLTTTDGRVQTYNMPGCF